MSNEFLENKVQDGYIVNMLTTPQTIVCNNMDEQTKAKPVFSDDDVTDETCPKNYKSDVRKKDKIGTVV